MSTAREQLDALAREVAELREDVRAIRSLLEASHIDPLGGVDISFVCPPWDDDEYCGTCGTFGGPNPSGDCPDCNDVTCVGKSQWSAHPAVERAAKSVQWDPKELPERATWDFKAAYARELDREENGHVRTELGTGNGPQPIALALAPSPTVRTSPSPNLRELVAAERTRDEDTE